MRRGLIGGARPGARRAALVAFAVGDAVAFLLFIIAAVGGTDDADRYGRVPLPGKGQIELPKGDVAVYYEERVELDEDDSLDLPQGLAVVAKRENRKIHAERSTQNAVNLDERSLREFAKLSIPAAGLYQVRARADAPGSNDPAVTLGKGQLDNLGPAAVRAGIAAGAGLLAALLLLLALRRPDEDSPPAIRL